MKIKYRVSIPFYNREEKKNLLIAFDKNEISGFYGSFISKFEKNFSKFSDCKYGVSVNSGTTALHLGLLSVGIKKGDEVIVSTLTNMATIFAILYIGAKPVPIDIEKDSFNIDVNLIEKKINKKTKAILVVHLFGQPVEMNIVKKIAKKYSLKIIEDCAEAHGALYKNKKVGSLGDVGCFSFYANKIISTGEGGMLTFNKKLYAEKAKNLKGLAFGKQNKFMHRDIGYNYRMSNLQSALGCAQLKKINSIIKKKIFIANQYRINLKYNNIIKVPAAKPNTKNVYWMICVTIKDCSHKNIKKIMEFLLKKGIETREMFVPYNMQNIFLKQKVVFKEECPLANAVSKNTFYLPSGVELREFEIKYISNQLLRAVQKYA